MFIAKGKEEGRDGIRWICLCTSTGKQLKKTKKPPQKKHLKQELQMLSLVLHERVE